MKSLVQRGHQFFTLRGGQRKKDEEEALHQEDCDPHGEVVKKVGIAGGAGEDGRGFGRATPETKGDDEG